MENIDRKNQESEEKVRDRPLQQVVFDYLKGQSPALYVAIATVFIVVLFSVFYIARISGNNQRAARLLAAAQTTRQFEDILGLYPKSPSAPVALLALASARFSAGDYAGASSRYSEFAAKYSKYPMLPVAELGQVMCCEGRGEIDKALMGFNAFITTHPGHFLTPQAIFGKARCLQISGKYAEARTVYEDFIAANPESKWRPSAEAALQTLSRQTRLQAAPDKENGGNSKSQTPNSK